MSTRKNAAYNIAYRVFSVLLPLVTMPYLTRVCGQDGVGLYSYAWTISEFFCLAAMLGLNDYGVREVARVRDDRQKLDLERHSSVTNGSSADLAPAAGNDEKVCSGR